MGKWGAVGVIKGTGIMMEAGFPSSQQDAGPLVWFKWIHYITDLLDGESFPPHSRVHCESAAVQYTLNTLVLQHCVFFDGTMWDYLFFLFHMVYSSCVHALCSTSAFSLFFSFPAPQDVDIPKVKARMA